MSTYGIDRLKGKYFPVLDHGFCAVVDSMGDDHAIARAARCSYGAGTKKISDDRSLIRTLIREMHTSPLEMCEIVVHVGLPIFVARQWVRHRTASLNEYSGRYSVMPMMFYEPEESRHQTQSKNNKQGSTHDHVGTLEYQGLAKNRKSVRRELVEQYEDCLSVDLTRELARIDLPLSTYTYWYWKIDLKNLLHFLKLRLDPHAQWEIQQYGRVIAGMVKEWLPITWEAFNDYILYGVNFSTQEQDVLKNIMADNDLGRDWSYECEQLEMSKRETKGFFAKLENMGEKLTDDIGLDLSSAKDAEFYENKIEQHAVKV